MIRLVTYFSAGFYAALVYTGHVDMAEHFLAASNAVASYIPVALEFFGGLI